MSSALSLMKHAWGCKCPRCKRGDLYRQGRFTLSLRKKCTQCGLNLKKNDAADGPAVFLIFILGAALVPLALLLEAWLAPPLWVHALLWLAVTLAITIGALRPLKAFVIALQFKHRPQDWE